MDGDVDAATAIVWIIAARAKLNGLGALSSYGVQRPVTVVQPA